MKRPFGMTILSLVLAWLGLAGAGNGWLILSGSFAEMPAVFGVLALAYSATAFPACIGLWRMQSWGLNALRAWMGVCVLFFASFTYAFSDFILGGILGGIGFLVFVGVLFLGLNGYVSSKLCRIT